MDRTLSDEMDRVDWSRDPDAVKSDGWSRRISIPIPAVFAYAAALSIAIWWGWTHQDRVTVGGAQQEAPVAEPELVQEEETVLAQDVDQESAEIPSGEALHKLKEQPRVTVPPELIRPAAYAPHKGSF